MITPTLPHVLCVDDEPGVLRSLERLLRGHFRVSCATSANEGLQLIRRTEFEVVISDLRMPDMCGTEFLEQVKTVSPRSMRLMLTGQAQVPDVLRSINDSEVFRFIRKPWDRQHLIDMVTYAAAVARDVPLPQTASSAHPATPHALDGTFPQFGSEVEVVLLMDEDPAIERLVRSVLGHDFLLLWARTPGEAVSLLHRHKVAVLMAGAHPGNRATLELIRAVKRSSPNIVAVVHAANCDCDTISSLINEGQIFRFIAKPAGPTFMGRTIQAALNKHRQLMAQPASVARHALDISRLAAAARSRHDPLRGAETDAMGLMAHSDMAALEAPGASLSGARWLRRLFGKT